MQHYINDEEFFKKNLSHINKLTGKILAYANIAPVLLACGIFLKLYEMPLFWLVIFSAFLIPFTIWLSIIRSPLTTIISFTFFYFTNITNNLLFFLEIKKEL